TDIPISAQSVSTVIDRLRAAPRGERKNGALSPAALAAASEHPQPAFSPIVLAGFVRMFEFALIVAVGFAVYTIYLLPDEGLSWRYIGASGAISVLSMFAFQTAEIYQVQAFRGH